MKLKRAIENAAASLIVAFAIAAGILLARLVFRSGDEALTRSLFGAFVGAFFAFLFIRVAEFLTKLYERHSRAFTALLALELRLNGIMSELSDSCYVLDNFAKTFDGIQEDDTTMPVWTSRLSEISLDRNLVIDLANIDFVNDMLSFGVDLRKHNDSIATANRTYDRTEERFLLLLQSDEEHAKANYVQNARELVRDFAKLRAYIASREVLCQELIAKVKVQLLDITFADRIYWRLTKKRYTPAFRKLLPKAVATVRTEMAAKRKQSQEELDKVYGRGDKDADGSES